MRHSISSCFVVLATFLLSPSLAHPAALTVNGTCESGPCSSVDSLFFGQTLSSSLAFNYTVGSDLYGLVASYATGYDNNGTNTALNVTATYLGVSPTTSNDTLNLHLLQNFFDNSPGSWDGAYTEHFPSYVSPTTGPGSSLAGSLSFGGQSIGTVGPLGTGSNDVIQTANLIGLDSNTLTSDLNLVLNFSAGTQPGAFISSVPEPAGLLPFALGLLLVTGAIISRKSYSSVRKLF